MKITVPKNPAEYFHRTEHAVRHSDAGLDSCWLYALRRVDRELDWQTRLGMLQLARAVRLGASLAMHQRPKNRQIGFTLIVGPAPLIARVTRL
jgi:hypothetical protein